MNLDATQLLTLKTAILAETDVGFVALRTAGNHGLMASFYNGFPAADVLLWNPRTRTADVFDAVTWSNFTPTDAPGSATYADRADAIKIKQMNLQNIAGFRDTVDATKPNIRLGLRDAVIQLPTGTAGALTSAGGAGGITVLTACTRKATRGEALYAQANAAVGTPVASPVVMAYVPVVEGQVTSENIDAALLL